MNILQKVELLEYYDYIAINEFVLAKYFKNFGKELYLQKNCNIEFNINFLNKILLAYPYLYYTKKYFNNINIEYIQHVISPKYHTPYYYEKYIKNSFKFYCKINNTKMIKYLWNKGSINDNLIAACEIGNLYAVKKLHNKKFYTGMEGKALLVAVNFGNYSVVKYLCENGVLSEKAINKILHGNCKIYNKKIYMYFNKVGYIVNHERFNSKI